jgi:hypothetical protein
MGLGARSEVLLLSYNFLAVATTRRSLGLGVGDNVGIFDEVRCLLVYPPRQLCPQNSSFCAWKSFRSCGEF